MSDHVRERESSGRSLSFREIGPKDFEVLARFLEENNVSSIIRTFNPFPMNSETAKRIACLPRRDRYYGGFLNDRFIGLSMLRGWDEGYAVPSFGIMVDHRFHGMGTGGRMLDYTIDEAVRIGCHRVRLSVFASNRRAVRLYLSKGFVEESRESVLLSNEPDERIIMFKEIS
ncbi:MAG: GNAT family N-acetyltransferase [Pyrinomonadaceae bacterium]